jgi:hypothetical protein
MRLAIERRLPASGFRLPAVVAAAALAACGNYGNGAIDDAPFYNALPRAEYLKVDVPKDAAQPLCGLGESKIATDTRNLGIGLAVGVYVILGVIDAVRSFPPTTRTADTRLWGPFPDGQHPGITVQVRMVRIAPDRFTFAVEQKRDPAGAFLTTLSAELNGAVAQRGSGTLHYDSANAAALGIGKVDDPTQGRLDIDYDFSSDPRTIALRTVGTLKSVSVDISSFAASGQTWLSLAFLDGADQVTASSKFVKSGAGSAKYSVKSGTFADVISECWDANYCRSYLKDPAGRITPPCTGGAFCEFGSSSSCVIAP